MNSKDPSRVLEEISGEHVALDLDLLPGALIKIQKENRRIMRTRYTLSLAVILATVVIVTLLFETPAVVSALSKMFGFIPGVGIVDQSAQLRVLAEPVSDSRDGFTLTVDNAVLDSEHTLITYKVEGPFETETNQAKSDLFGVCFEAAQLRLADGTVLSAPGGFPDETWTSGYRVSYSYPAIPAGIDRATLFLPCVHARPNGQGPENWEVALAFIPAPPSLTVYPIGSQAKPSPETTPAEITSTASNGIQLNLDSAIPLSDGQLVQIRLDWSDNPQIAGITLEPQDVKIFDADGQEVAFEPSSEAIDPNAGDGRSSVFGYKTPPLAAGAPARLVVEAASEVTYSAAATFSFDPGPNRQAEQVWELNKDLEIDGRTLRILNVSVAEEARNASLSIEMASDDGIFMAGIVDPEHPPLSGGNSEDSAGGPTHTFWSSINYEGGLPEGPITLVITGYVVRLPGPWVVEWTPAAAPADDAASLDQPQTACLSESAWKAALANPQPIPADLNYKVISAAYNDETQANPLALANLDGSENRLLVADGYDPSVSPDGKRLVYTHAGGIYIYDLTTSANELIPGTGNNTGLVRPFWAPDGQQIGFTGTPASTSPNVYLSDLDGSNPRLLAGEEPLKLMQGWLPDGRILYVTLDKNGPVLKLANLQNEEARALFNLPELTTPITLSKDGRRLALNWLDPAGEKHILYVFTLDGSQRKPLLELSSTGNIAAMLWTPDGNRLLVDLSWNVADEPYSKALVEVDTCRIIPLSNLKGSVLDWVPW